MKCWRSSSVKACASSICNSPTFSGRPKASLCPATVWKKCWNAACGLTARPSRDLRASRNRICTCSPTRSPFGCSPGRATVTKSCGRASSATCTIRTARLSRVTRVMCSSARWHMPKRWALSTTSGRSWNFSSSATWVRRPCRMTWAAILTFPRATRRSVCAVTSWKRCWR